MKIFSCLALFILLATASCNKPEKAPTTEAAPADSLAAPEDNTQAPGPEAERAGGAR
jgi:hypothetical protein